MMNNYDSEIIFWKDLYSSLEDPIMWYAAARARYRDGVEYLTTKDVKNIMLEYRKVLDRIRTGELPVEKCRRDYELSGGQIDD